MEKQMTADEVINLYQDFRSRKRLSDQYLEENGYETRKENDCDFVGDYGYGIVFLRDDGVDILIDEIYRLRERMKPKKVIYDDSRLGKPGITEYSLAICPSCRWAVKFEDTASKFCRKCGQALDWGEE